MKNKIIRVLLIILILSVILWGFISPNGIRSVFANNLWSLKFLQNASESSPVLPAPPASYKRAPLLLALKSVKQGQLDSAKMLLNPMIAEEDPLALDVYAGILYLQEDYQTAFSTWLQIGDESALIQSVLDLISKGKRQHLLNAFLNLTALDPEQHTLRSLGSFGVRLSDHEAIAILQQSITNHPDSPQLINWFLELGERYISQGAYHQAKAVYQRILVEDPTHPEALEAIKNLSDYIEP